MPTSIEVHNSGTHPEPMYWAAAAAEHGFSCRYYTSSSFARRSVLMRAAERIARWQPRVSSTLLRRRLPAEVDGVAVVGVARILGLVEQLRRGFGEVGDELVDARMRRFRRLSAKHSRRTRSDVVVAQYTSALGAFEASPDATKILLYPIAHHGWMTRHLASEARRNPRWAEFLQGAELTDERRSLLDAEIALADRIIVPSSFARDTFIEMQIAPERVEVISLGAPGSFSLTTSRAGIRDSERPGRSPLSVIFAGQVNQRKGISYLLDALNRLGPDAVELTMIGPASSDVRKVISDDYPSVRLLGSMPRIELMRAMERSDVLVLPSLAEGFGLVALEAMAVGTPAIVSDRTFGSDVIHHGVDGWVVNAGSTEQLAALLSELSNNRELVDAAGVAAARRAEDFTWGEYTRTVGERLQSL